MFFAYCFNNSDIELGIWLCSHRERERLPNPIEDEIYEKFKKMLNGEKSAENAIKTSMKINRLLLSKNRKKIPFTGKKEEVIYIKY